MTNPRYTWTNFYSELADKLLPFKENRGELIDKLQSLYARIDMKFPKLDHASRPSDIDPYTVFGLFNKGISDSSRRKIIAAIAAEFGVEAEQPSDFDGVPVLNNQNATFYAFSGDGRRGEHDIDNLWRTFEAGIALAAADNEKNRAAFIDAYDATADQFGLGWRLTMGLYWARPSAFINLDSRNRWYMGDMAAAGASIADAFPKGKDSPVRSGVDYLEICDAVKSQLSTEDCPHPDFPSLSHAAFVESERVNNENKAAKEATSKEVETNALGDADVETVRHWLYSPGTGAHLWNELLERGEMAIGWEEIGDLHQYPTKESMKMAMRESIDPELSFKNAAHATWQFANEMRPGDIVYAKKGMHEVVGRGIVTSDYRFDTERGEDRSNIRSVEWTHAGSWEYPGQAPMKTLTDVTPYTQLLSQLESLFEEGDTKDDSLEAEIMYPAYTKAGFLDDVFMDENEYDTLSDLLKRKKNVILQGAPGVGKTFVAKRLAYSIMGEKDVSRVMMVQFHQSYSYEDFIEGFRPSASSFDLVKGAFYEFCKKAADDEGRDYFFIIDEINRGNLSKIFGELFMLIESDKRGPKNKLQLLYSRELFYVPENVHLVGMMNTADRSLAMLDYALRRRFAFFDMRPGFDSDGFSSYLEDLASPKFNELIACVERLNKSIADDESLGDGFCIGHSYFCGLKQEDATDARLSAIVDYELVPLLKEYWFDEPSKVREWSGALHRSVK